MKQNRRPARSRSQAGSVLVTTMIAAVALSMLGAFAAMQARLDFLLLHHARTALETFVAAESGLDHALADLAADPAYERLLAGPDRRAGTADDHEYPFVLPPPVFFPHAPYRYEVRVSPSGPEAFEITARGIGPASASRAVVAAVARTSEPYLPAAMSLAAPRATLSLGSEFFITGTEAAAGSSGLPAVAVDGFDAAAALAAGLPPDAAARLIGAGKIPSVAPAAVPAAEAVLAAAKHAGARELAGTAGGDLGNGLFLSRSSLRLVDATASGILVVDGSVEFGGASTFSGVIVALGDIRVDWGSEAVLNGAVVVGRNGTVMALRGRGQIAYDHRTVERVAAAFPGLLPHRVRVTGWREQRDPAP